MRPLRRSAADLEGDQHSAGAVSALPARHRHVDRARAVGGYDGALRAIVHALKYEGRRSLARPLAELMRIRGADMLTGADWAVPVPLHAVAPARARLQSGRRSRAPSRRAGPPGPPPHTGNAHADRSCRRRGAIATSAVLSAVTRADGRPTGLEESTVVLIDDVSTTGATLDACARVLKEAGVREVRALTAARVVTPPR